ncbi:hypothetical protein [Amycolatopsis vastitatis]|nr:hypothetical protein [Amycolatopsis vastitatis]
MRHRPAGARLGRYHRKVTVAFLVAVEAAEQHRPTLMFLMDEPVTTFSY